MLNTLLCPPVIFECFLAWINDLSVLATNIFEHRKPIQLTTTATLTDHAAWWQNRNTHADLEEQNHKWQNCSATTDTVDLTAGERNQQDWQCTYNAVTRCVRVNTAVVEKQWALHIPSVFVVLVIQHEHGMRRITLSPVAYLPLPYFPIFSHKRRDLRGKIIQHKVCFIFRTTFVWNVSHSKNNSGRYSYKCRYVFM
jgi:hypothetical protein